jgi:fermentation-respiration switch protein FrsA (DUF1100 family)
MGRIVCILLAAFVMPAAAVAASDERVPLRLASGTTVQIRLLRAADTTVRLPAIVVLGGLERGAAVVDLVPRTPEAVLVGFDYPVAVPHSVAWNEVLPLARRLERGVNETVEIVARVHSMLAHRPDIDASRLTIVGVSLGAPFAVIGAAGQDYRGVVIVDGFGDLAHTIRHQFARRWQPRYGVFGDALAWLAQTAIMRLVALPEPADYARRLRAGQRVYMLSAEQDEFVPKESRQALQQALQQSDARLTVGQTSGRHVRGEDAQTIALLFSLVRDWMRQQALLD